MVDSSCKDLFLWVKVLECFCDSCLRFWANVVWVLRVVGIPPTKVNVILWYFGFPIGVKGSVVVLSEFYPEVVFSLCDKFYRGSSVFWLIDVIACSWVGPSFNKRVFLKVCMSFNVDGKVAFLSSMDCLLCVG